VSVITIPIKVRPMLVSGMLASSTRGPVILIDSEQPELQQVVALWHEVLHLLGVTDEATAESIAARLAGADPGVLRLVHRNINVPGDDIPAHTPLYDLEDLERFTGLAASAAVQAALQAIDDEPEVPGPMPDEMWAALNGDRDAVENAIRIAVRQTKDGIRERLLAHEPA
jgi:hypothetical protein